MSPEWLVGGLLNIRALLNETKGIVDGRLEGGEEKEHRQDRIERSRKGTDCASILALGIRLDRRTNWSRQREKTRLATALFFIHNGSSQSCSACVPLFFFPCC
jgi:hypothetical protein